MNSNSIILETANLAKITLNAPDKLNALDMDMVLPMGNQLAQWRLDPNVSAVLIKGAGSKAFCAGGDIVNVCKMVKTDFAEAIKFFWSEYRTNWRIKNFPKPYIALMDGYVMGGGVGVSAHGSYRIVTEKTMLAMPETAIGFFPDVGGSYFLPKLAGNMGLYLGLTGARLKAEDLIALGLATHYIASADIPNLEAALEEADYSEDAFAQTDEILSQYCTEPPLTSALLENEAQINQIFNAENVEQILENLHQADNELSQKQLKLLSRMSPISLKVTFEQLKRAKGMSFDAAMQQELRLSHHMLQDSDFLEGVRALLIDKDKNANWQFGSVEQVSAAFVEKFFAPIDNELFFDWDKAIDFVSK